MRIYFSILLCIFCLSGLGQTPAKDPTWQKINALSDNFSTDASLDCAGGGVYYLTNFTTPSWTIVNSSGWHGTTPHTDGVTALAVNGSKVYAGTSTAEGYNGGLYYSSGGGAWTLQNLPNSYSPKPTYPFVTAVAFNGSNVYAGLEGGVDYYNGTSWTSTTTLIASSSITWDVTSLAVSGSYLFAGTYGLSGNGGVSLYNGTTWTTVSTGLTNTFVLSLAITNPTGICIAAGTEGGGIFYSSNSGTNWTSVNGTGLTNLQINALAVDGSTLIAGTSAGVFYSTNYSSGSPTWTSANSSGLTNTYITTLAVISSGKIVAGTNGGGVFYSTNYSSGSPTWSAINGTGTGALPSMSVSSIVYDGSSKLYVGICPKWRVMDCSVSDCCGGNTPSDVSLTTGTGLILNDGSTVTCYGNYLDQGTVETYNAKYGYGYYEMYAKTPYTSGVLPDKFHPSFWSYYDVRYSYSTSSCLYDHQEVDIFEPGGWQYAGTTNGFGYWHDNVGGSCLCTGSSSTCPSTKTINSTYTYSGYLYSGYHKYAVEFGQNRMIYYFDDVPIYSVYNQPNFAIEGLFQTQISAGLDNPPASYVTGDVIPASYTIQYFNYYKLNLQCSNSVTCTNNTSGSVGTLYLTGTNAYVPAVYSNITIAPNAAITLSSANNAWTYRAVNSITISNVNGGTFSVPSGTAFSLIPTTCDY